MDGFRVGSVVIDVNDLATMRAFWSGALGYQPETEYESDDWVKLVPPDGERVNVSLQLVPEPRKGKNRLHLDLYARDQRAEVARLRGLGAKVEREPGPDEDFVVMSDPEGNLFCVIDRSEDV